MFWARARRTGRRRGTCRRTRWCWRRRRPRCRRSCGSGRSRAGAGRVVGARAGLVLRRRVGRDAAVLALHLVVEEPERRAQPGVRRLARDVEAVGVDDRHDDRARRVDELRRACAAPVVGQQVVGELDRVLRRGPLTGVVDAQLQEDRLAVLRLRVLRDLDAVDRPALDRRVVERELLRRGPGSASRAASSRGRSRRGAGTGCCRWAAGSSGSTRRTSSPRLDRPSACASRSATRTSKVKPASRSFFSSPAPCSTTSTEFPSPCSVRSRPRVCSRRLSLRAAVSTSTICDLPVLRSAIFTKPIERSALEALPRKRQAWTTSFWPALTKPSASSLEPNPADPATKRPELASKTPRSQSPRPDRRARTRPDSAAVVRDRLGACGAADVLRVADARDRDVGAHTLAGSGGRRRGGRQRGRHQRARHHGDADGLGASRALHDGGMIRSCAPPGRDGRSPCDESFAHLRRTVSPDWPPGRPVKRAVVGRQLCSPAFP